MTAWGSVGFFSPGRCVHGCARLRNAAQNLGVAGGFRHGPRTVAHVGCARNVRVGGISVAVAPASRWQTVACAYRCSDSTYASNRAPRRSTTTHDVTDQASVQGKCARSRTAVDRRFPCSDVQGRSIFASGREQ